MNKETSPLNESLLKGCAAFIIALGVLLSAQMYLAFSAIVHEQYDIRLEGVVTHAESCVDADDLRECVRTGVPSEKYALLQEEFNRIGDDFGLAYLYVVIPTDDGSNAMISVISATSRAEREAGERDDPLLYRIEGAYSADSMKKYRSAWDTDGFSCFTEVSDYGLCYTVCKPLKASDGETFALLCADYGVPGLRRFIAARVYENIGLTLALCLVFGTLLVVWLRRNVTGPILALEKSALRVARMSREATDNASSIAVDNMPGANALEELRSLANAIAQLSQEVQHRAADSAVAQARAMSAEEEIEGMFRVAYQDALTHVKNKAAYDARRAELTVDIAEHRAQFAIVMMDLNDLKRINDTYGHEHGNEYIIGACDILCKVFAHSPVYRLGGDEFVAVLLGQDFNARSELFEELRSRLLLAQEGPSKQPWERFSAAAGMAVFDPETDKAVDDVFRRADEAMYDNKRSLKHSAGAP